MKLIIKRLVLASNLFWAVLLPNLAAADQQEGCLKLKELRSEYDAVTKGTAMPLELKFKSHECHLAVGSPSFDVSLSAETESGFELRTHDRSYGKIKKSESSSAREVADEMKLKVFVTIVGELTPANYGIPAVLSYQAIDNKGNLVQQSTPLVIPVKVVASLAEIHVKRTVKRDAEWVKPLKITGMVAAGIVLVPVLFAVGIFQLITGIEIFSNC